MSAGKPKHGTITDSTIARMAGNILPYYLSKWVDEVAVERTVTAARMIAAEVERTSPTGASASTTIEVPR